MLRLERAPYAKVRDVNWAKRKALVRHAYESVPYYRKAFAQRGLAPDDIRDEQDFLGLPLLHKKDIRANQNSLLSKHVRPRRKAKATTGGSTGVPLQLYHDRRAPTYALQWRTLSWWGVSPWMDTARIWRIPQPIRDRRLLYKLKRWPSCVVTLDAADMSEKAIHAFLRDWGRVQPRILCGYVGGVDHVARFILSLGLSVSPPKVVWLTAAPVTAVQRENIRRAFGAPVYDQYACSEILYIAAECEAHCGLHIVSDYRHVEILDENGEPCVPGHTGNVVVTDLENYVFPLIRYVTGDQAYLLERTCECGRSLPLLSPVKGRTSDVIRLPGGKSVSGEYLTTIFDDEPLAVESFRVVQKEDYSIEVEYVPRGGDSGEAIQSVRDTVKQLTGGEVPVIFVEKDSLSHDRGKIRYVVSEVDSGDAPAYPGKT